MDQETRDELLMAHHIFLGTLCGALKVLSPEVIEAVREALVEKLADAPLNHPTLEAATARALAMVPKES
jgi:hypothetical protein